MSTPSESAVPAPRTNQGVIHDLGYRHYDGPRLGRAYIARALAAREREGAYGLGRSARSKVMPMLLLGAICLPAFIIAVVAAVTDVDELPADYTSYVLNVQALVMIYVAAQSPALVSRDLRFRVMSLYFSRPLHRIDYVVAKYAAMTTAVFVLMALPLTIMFVGALLAKLPIDEQVPDYLRSLGGALLTALVLCRHRPGHRGHHAAARTGGRGDHRGARRAVRRAGCDAGDRRRGERGHGRRLRRTDLAVHPRPRRAERGARRRARRCPRAAGDRSGASSSWS